jgi:Tir chaperone protein (CesT).
MLEEHLKTLAQELELDTTFPRDENKMAQLQLNPSLLISVRQLDPGVLFFSTLAPCPKEKREELFMWLMKANFLAQGTGGGAIALDPDENFLTLSRALPYDMNYKTFKENLEDFANFVDYWKEELLRYQEKTNP